MLAECDGSMPLQVWLLQDMRESRRGISDGQEPGHGKPVL